MYSDSIILRTVIQAGLTTKGSELTAAELDGNFIALWQDLKERLSAGALPDYGSGTTYTDGDAVSFDGFTWLYIFATPTSGTTPGSDEDVWIKIPVEFLAHQKDKDEALAKGTADEVTANEIRTFLDTPVVSGNWFNTDLTADANHTHDAAGFGSAVNNLSHWWLDASDFAPTGGRASHERWGYGTGSDDVIDRVRNGAGDLVYEATGDKHQKAYGRYYFGNGWIESGALDGGQGLKIFGGNVTTLFGYASGEIRQIGNIGVDSIVSDNSSVESYFTQKKGSHLWRYGRESDDGAIVGNIGGSNVVTEIVRFLQSNAKTIFRVGHINLKPLTTSEINALTSTEGDITYNSTLGALCFKDASGWRKVTHSNM